MFHLITHVQFVSVCMLRSVWITQPPSLSSFSCIMWNVLNNWKWKLKTHNLFRGCFFWFWPYHIETPLYSIDIDIISNENFVYRYTLPTSDLNLFEIWEHIAWKATLFRIFGRNQKQSEPSNQKALGRISLSVLCFVFSIQWCWNFSLLWIPNIFQMCKRWRSWTCVLKLAESAQSGVWHWDDHVVIILHSCYNGEKTVIPTFRLEARFFIWSDWLHFDFMNICVQIWILVYNYLLINYYPSFWSSTLLAIRKRCANF